MNRWSFFWIVLVGLSSCISMGEPFTAIPPGIWRGTLYLSEEEDHFDEKTGGVLPFNFEVIYDTPDSFHIEIINGEERIVVPDIRMGVDRRTARDTIRIDFPVYDSYIEAQYEEDAIEGWWVAPNRGDYRIRFKALHGQRYRFFQTLETPDADLSGTWDCSFSIESDAPSRSIGLFKQNGNLITGTFLSPTGDDRFLEGVVNGDRLHLSVFDGSHAYLYEAKILPDGQLTGIYRSGKHYKTYWEAWRNDTLELTDLGDPMTMTTMRADEPFIIRLPDPEGNPVDIREGRYRDRPKIIQILGTWCPNCRDETTFLVDYLRQHPDPGFEVLGISFERHTDTLKALQAIHTYKDKMNVPYPIVYGGSSNKDKASETLPMLNRVMAFPTLIFLHADNQVEAIHTGFSGPATPGYEPFKKEFEEFISKITSPHE